MRGLVLLWDSLNTFLAALEDHTQATAGGRTVLPGAHSWQLSELSDLLCGYIGRTMRQIDRSCATTRETAPGVRVGEGRIGPGGAPAGVMAALADVIAITGWPPRPRQRPQRWLAGDTIPAAHVERLQAAARIIRREISGRTDEELAAERARDEELRISELVWQFDSSIPFDFMRKYQAEVQRDRRELDELRRRRDDQDEETLPTWQEAVEILEINIAALQRANRNSWHDWLELQALLGRHAPEIAAKLPYLPTSKEVENLDGSAAGRQCRDARLLWEQRLRQTAAQRQPDQPAAATQQPAAEEADEPAIARLLAVFTNGVADDRIRRAAGVLGGNGSANEKLYKIDNLIRLPVTASAGALGKLLGVTGTAIKRSEWWGRNRKGMRDDKSGRRQAELTELATRREPRSADGD